MTSHTEKVRHTARQSVTEQPVSRFIWESQPEHEKSVIEALAKNYDLPYSEKSVGDMIYNIAQELSANYYNVNDTDIYP